jgi:probable rRNA maturation factor
MGGSAGSSVRGGPSGDGASGVGVAVEISDPGGRLGAGRVEWLRGLACEAVRRLGATGQVRVRVVGDAEMSSAHERFAGVRGTTDVLTFDLSERAGPRTELDTDILACFDEASRQASARGHAVERELLLYVVHGVLHCLGHDDHDEESSRAMHALEDEVLSAIGVGATFGAGGVP